MVKVGEFVSLPASEGLWHEWKIWVEYQWLDQRYDTVEKMAHQIFLSGWCRKNEWAIR